MMTRSSTFSGSKFVLFTVTVFPEVEKTLSLLALLAGMARTALATEDRKNSREEKLLPFYLLWSLSAADTIVVGQQSECVCDSVCVSVGGGGDLFQPIL